MDGSLNFYFSNPGLGADANYLSMNREYLAGHSGIAVVSPKVKEAWVGFMNMGEAVKFKFDKGLDASWRIRDRRPASSVDPAGELGEAMLNVSSMISDHLRILISQVFKDGKLPASVRREIMMFSFASLRESLISCDKAVGTWRPMRGKVIHQGVEISHCWLEDVPGNVMDVLPWNYLVAPAGYTCHKSELVKNYQGVSVLSDGYGSEFGAYLRGERQHATCEITASEFRRSYITLGDHIVSFLSRSRLPTQY